MSDYLAKLTDEKSELRSTLCHLELQISQYRDREADHLEVSRPVILHWLQRLPLGGNWDCHVSVA